MEQIPVTLESGFQPGFWGWTIQPDPGRFGVLRVRHGQPSGCPILASLAQNRPRSASGRNNFWRNETSPRAHPSQNHYGWYILLFSALFDQSELRPSQYDLRSRSAFYWASPAVWTSATSCAMSAA